jgi:hypothetical protein
LTVVVKLWTRFATTRNFGLNDAAIIAATVRFAQNSSFSSLWLIFAQVFAFGQSITLAVATDHGLGRHVTDLQDSEIAELSKVGACLTPDPDSWC